MPIFRYENGNQAENWPAGTFENERPLGVVFRSLAGRPAQKRGGYESGTFLALSNQSSRRENPRPNSIYGAPYRSSLAGAKKW